MTDYKVHPHGYTVREGTGRMIARVVDTVDKLNPYVEVGALAMIEIPPNCMITDLDAQRAHETRQVVLSLVERFMCSAHESEYDDLLRRLRDLWMSEVLP